MTRLTRTQLVAWRQEQLARQGGCCALCKLPCKDSEAVADHDHHTGYLRAVLHRSCNAMLGHIENNSKRYAMKSVAAFLMGAGPYLQRHVTPQVEFLYPLHRTEEEKRVARNTKARKKRAAKKAAE